MIYEVQQDAHVVPLDTFHPLGSTQLYRNYLSSSKVILYLFNFSHLTTLRLHEVVVSLGENLFN